MIIAQVIGIRFLQSVIPLAPIPLPILKLDKEEQSRTSSSADPQHAETNPIPRRIQRCLTAQENITRNDTPQIAKANLHSRANRPLIVPRHEVGQPDQRDGLSDVAAGHDEEESKVLDARREVVLCEEHDVSDGGDDEAEDAEPVAVAETVG